MTTYGRPRPLPLTPTQVPSAFGMRQVLTHQNPLSRETLLELLDSVQLKLFARRGKQTTLVVHGGVISVLGTQHRYVTTDVDYIERVLPEEVEKRMKGEMLARNRSSSSLTSIAKRMGRALSAGKGDVRKCMRECVAEAAVEFNAKHPNVHSRLEDDWMNSAADVALPWRLDANSHMFDPLVTSALRNAEEEGRVIYDKPGLRLIGIPLSWTIALKLQRYTYKDQDDVVALLPFLLDNGSNGNNNGNTNTSSNARVNEMLEVEFADNVERHLIRQCPEMEIEMFPVRAREEWRARLRDCVRMAKYLMGAQRVGTGQE